MEPAIAHSAGGATESPGWVDGLGTAMGTAMGTDVGTDVGTEVDTDRGTDRGTARCARPGVGSAAVARSGAG